MREWGTHAVSCARSSRIALLRLAPVVMTHRPVRRARRRDCVVSITVARYLCRTLVQHRSIALVHPISNVLRLGTLVKDRGEWPAPAQHDHKRVPCYFVHVKVPHLPRPQATHMGRDGAVLRYAGTALSPDAHP